MQRWTDALSASLWGERLRQARARALTLWVLSGITPLSIFGDGVSDTCLSAVHVALVSVSVHAYTLGRERPARHVGRVHSNTILYTVLEWSMGEALCTSVALELLADMYAIYVCRAVLILMSTGIRKYSCFLSILSEYSAKLRVYIYRTVYSTYI